MRAALKAAIELDSKSANAAPRRPWRFVFGGIAVLLVAAYAVAIIMGKIPASRQISLSGIVLFVIAAMLVIGLFRPQWFREIQGLQFGSFRVDMRERLDKIQATQEDQNKNLNEIHFILESLVTQTQMKHLRGLDRGFTGNYRRSPQLLAELRYLRDVGLIESIEEKFHFADLPATKFDLSHYVRLTQRGREYLRRVSMAVPPSDASAPQTPRPHLHQPTPPLPSCTHPAPPGARRVSSSRTVCCAFRGRRQLWCQAPGTATCSTCGSLSSTSAERR